MGVDQLGDVCGLLMLDKKVLKLLNLVEELYSWRIIHVASMQKVFREQLSIPFKITAQRNVLAIKFIESFLKLIFICEKLATLLVKLVDLIR
jgi:hypothetical protein